MSAPHFDGFKWTGECRLPKRGDWFLNHWSKKPSQARVDFVLANPAESNRFIYRKLENSTVCDETCDKKSRKFVIRAASGKFYSGPHYASANTPDEAILFDTCSGAFAWALKNTDRNTPDALVEVGPVTSPQWRVIGQV